MIFNNWQVLYYIIVLTNIYVHIYILSHLLDGPHSLDKLSSEWNRGPFARYKLPNQWVDLYTRHFIE